MNKVLESSLIDVHHHILPPEYLAADLLAQAEHEELASVVLVSPDEALLRETLQALERQTPGQPRIEFIRRSLADRSAAIVAPRCRRTSPRSTPQSALAAGRVRRLELTASPRSRCPRCGSRVRARPPGAGRGGRSPGRPRCEWP